MKENLDYKVKIDMPNVIELISETFDGVLDYMFPGMLVFGGALRDIIAGFGLHHDLDIAASHSEGKKFIQYLETSSKWVEECVVDQYKKQAKIMKDKTSDIVSPHSMENGMLDLDRNLPCIIKPKFSNYGNVQSVRTFINSSGRKLQIIIGKSNLFTLKEHPPVLIVKDVDFICCGIIMDIDGNVYEIIEGAKDDCIKKVLRINKNADIEFHNLNERIKKLTNRGWKSEINLAQIRQRQVRLKKIAKRKIDDVSIHEYTLLNGVTQIVVNTSKMQIFKCCNNSNTKTLELFRNILRNYNLTKTVRNCGVSVSYNDHHHVVISITSRNIDTATNVKNALLYQEHKFLLHQKMVQRNPYEQEYKIDLPRPKKREGGYYCGAITKSSIDRSLKIHTHKNEFASKVYDCPLPNACTFTLDTAACSTGKTISPTYTLDEEIEWVGIEKGNEERKIREPDLKMFEEKKLKKEELAESGEEKPAEKHKITDKKVLIPDDVGLINKTELLAVGGYNASGQLGTGDQTMENCSNLKIIKKEKMEIEYGAHLVDTQAQHKRMQLDLLYQTIEMDKISKHFAGKQIEPLNIEEKEKLVKYLALKL